MDFGGGDGDRPVVVDEGGRGILFSPKNLAIVRGPPALLRRASGGVGDEGLQPEQRVAYERLSRAIHAEAPFGPPDETQPVVTNLNISNTHFCNMGCSYCYNELPSKDRKGSETPTGMSLATARRTVDALIEQSGQAPALKLVFIGGEPLLEKDVLYETVRYARQRAGMLEKSVAVTVYTNGLGMDDAFIDWANDNDAHLVLSLDGPPEQNDRARVLRGGQGSSKKVLPRIRVMMDRYTGRVRTVTAVSTRPTELLPLAKYLLALGFNDIQIQAAYAEDGFGQRGDVSDLVELRDWYRDLLLSGTVFSLAPFCGVLKRLAVRRRAIASWYPCMAGHRTLGIGPEGEIHTCHHFVGEDDDIIGHVRDGLPPVDARRSRFRRVDQREPCRSCWARHACGGQCYHRAKTAGVGHFGVTEEFCRGRKALIRTTLDLFADIATRDRTVLGRLLQGDLTRVPVSEEAYRMTTLAPSGGNRRVGLPVVSF